MTVSDGTCALIVQAVACAAAEIILKEESAETSQAGRTAVGQVQRSVHDVYRCLGKSYFDMHIACCTDRYGQDTGATNQWRCGFLSVQGGCAALGLLSPSTVPLPLVWDTKAKPYKNKEKDGALALGGRRLTMIHNNQLGVGSRGGRDAGEEARGG